MVSRAAKAAKSRLWRVFFRSTKSASSAVETSRTGRFDVTLAAVSMHSVVFRWKHEVSIQSAMRFVKQLRKSDPSIGPPPEKGRTFCDKAGDRAGASVESEMLVEESV